MEPGELIQRLGFRRWYERQLIDSHVCLVTALLATILITVCIEGVRFNGPIDKAVRLLVIIFVFGLVAFFAMRRFVSGFNLATRYSNNSNCPKCDTWGRFDLSSTASTDGSFEVKCRKCAERWRVP